MLLKSIPATQGMSRSQLFQFVEPNSSGVITLATYQIQDQHIVEARKPTLETELRQVLAPGEAANLFKNEDDGLWFGSVMKNKGGRIITTQQPSKQSIDHKNHINSMMNSPPKTRPLQTEHIQQQGKKHRYSITQPTHQITMQTTNVVAQLNL